MLDSETRATECGEQEQRQCKKPYREVNSRASRQVRQVPTGASHRLVLAADDCRRTARQDRSPSHGNLRTEVEAPSTPTAPAQRIPLATPYYPGCCYEFPHLPRLCLIAESRSETPERASVVDASESEQVIGRRKRQPQTHR